MCFYDIKEMACKCYKWGDFRQHCSREYRTGVTCGMKLVMNRYRFPEKCKICVKIETKQRAIYKEEEKLSRWRKETNRTASMEKAQDNLIRLKGDIQTLLDEKEKRHVGIGGSFLTPESFTFIIGSIRSSLQVVDELCRKIRTNWNSRTLLYDRLESVLNYALEMNKGFQELEQIGFSSFEQEDLTAINAIAKQIEKDIATGLPFLQNMSRDSDSLTLRSVRKEEGELYKFMNGLRHSEATLDLRLMDIRRKLVVPPTSLRPLPRRRRHILGPSSERQRTRLLTQCLGFTRPRSCLLIMAMFATFIGLSCFLGVYFTIEKRYGYSMSDAFTLAGWVIAVGALISTGVLAYHFPHCKCWTAKKQDGHAMVHELQGLVELPG